MTMFRNEQFTTAVQVARTVALAARVETVGDEVFAAIAPLAAGLLSDSALIVEAERRGMYVTEAYAVTNLRSELAAQVRNHCTVPTEVALSGNTDMAVRAVADWIENPPEWVTSEAGAR